MRIIKILTVYCLMQLCFCTLKDSLCEEKKVREAMYKTKPKYKKELESRSRKIATSRSMLRALSLCTVYHGQLVIKYISEDHKYEEDIRQQDLELLRNLRVIKGPVYLDLGNYPKVKNLSFLRNLRMIEDLRVKLRVTYLPKHHSLASSPDIEEKEHTEWYAFIKCQVHGILPGFWSFEDLRKVLKPLFTGKEIGDIYQWRGSVSGKKVAAVTNKYYSNEEPYCDVQGTQFTFTEAKPSVKMKKDGRYLICGGDCRTRLFILPKKAVLGSLKQRLTIFHYSLH